jgi:GH25 family lysozyme M1 (1,4-beta-N-acetylmuramidase)
MLAIPTPADAAPTRVPGIDVSSNQGVIDWATLATTKNRFVIMRATRGDFAAGNPPVVQAQDTRYAEYLAGATANGFVVGAYHRANADHGTDDALDEANFFVDHAQIEAGDVVPALDIEDPHDLTPDELVDWVRTWVKRVRARTGVRPMIYTGPYFWRTNLADSTWFAVHGYPLWVAHWDVPSPDVPADGWGGVGWSYWQWTVGDTGSVPGITTMIDRDRFHGPDLVHGTIASVALSPAAGGTVTGPGLRCGGGDVDCARLANPDDVLSLTAEPASGAVVMGWTEACGSVGVSPTCDVTAVGDVSTSAVFGYPVTAQILDSGGGSVTSAPVGIDCGADCEESFPAGSTVTLHAEADSASVFEGWSGACTGTDPDCTFAASAPTSATASFASMIAVEEDGVGTRFAWARTLDDGAIGGSYRWERRAGAATTFDVAGGVATLSVRSGPSKGKGRVRIDGEVADTFDGYAPSPGELTLRYDGLGPGPHELRVTVLGAKRATARGTVVAIDALRWGGSLHEDPRGVASWASVDDAEASGGHVAISDAAGASARIAFTGSGVSVRLARGPSMGRAELRIDGALVRTVDLFGISAGWRTIDVALGLPDGPHVATVVVVGSHRPASRGSAVGVDRWIVR